VDWRDRTIGIVLGVVLGVGVVVAFVFVLSERTVDAPSLSTGQAPVGAKPHGHAKHHHPQKRSKRSPQPAPPPVATVRIVGGAPPPGGPAELQYAQGEVIRLNVVSDATLGVELTGYGVTRTVVANQPTEIDAAATRAGTFALIVADSHIDVARITVAGRSS
jgi:hypothetical protein